MDLKENERIDDLQFNNLKIIQNKKGFCFGIDAVLLSDFAKRMKNCDFVVDLCTGTGVLPILLSGKTSAKKIVGVEIQPEFAEMATRSVKLNCLEDKIEIINRDLNNLNDAVKSGTVDVVTVNPPYIKKGSGIINEKDTLTIARHEISCTLEDVVRVAARILKSDGEFYMIHKPERLVDIFCVMRKYKIEPKVIKFVHPDKNKLPNLVLVLGKRCGGSFLKFEEPLYVYEGGTYTDEIYKIYNMNED